MIDSTSELPQAKPNAYLERKKERERDNDIIRRRSEFTKSVKRIVSEAASPTINKFSSNVALTDTQEEVLHNIVLDAIGVFKIGRTHTERIREGRHRGNTVIIDPVEVGWRERIEKRGIVDIDGALKTAQDAAVVVLNEVPNLGATPNRK